jgi:hypothetical protein
LEDVMRLVGTKVGVLTWILVGTKAFDGENPGSVVENRSV